MKIKVLNVLPFDSSDSHNASWEIAQVTLKDEGYYECIAVSSAGTGRARTFLDVSGKHTNQDSFTLSQADNRQLIQLIW